MTLYASNQGKGQRIIRWGVQATPDTAEDLSGASANTAYVTDCELTPKREIIERRLISPKTHGIPSIVSGEYMEVSATGDIVPRTITSANASDLPINAHEMLSGSGWSLTSDSTDKTHTYVLDGQGKQLTVRQIMLNIDNSVHRIKEAHNVRGDLTISGEAGSVITMSYDGLGANTYNLVETVTGSAYTGNVVFPSASQQPLILKNATVQLYNIDEDILYDGGTLGSPGSDGFLKSFTLSCNTNPTLRKNAIASDGVSGSYLDPDRPSLELKVEMNDLVVDRFQKNRDAWEIFIKIPQPGANSNSMSIICYAHLDGELGLAEVGDGIYVVTLPFLLSYPADVADNSPEAGTNPFQAWTTASNRGVPVLPASTLPTGLCAIQFRTES
jgi:hypothetical protein